MRWLIALDPVGTARTTVQSKFVAAKQPSYKRNRCQENEENYAQNDWADDLSEQLTEVEPCLVERRKRARNCQSQYAQKSAYD